MIVDAGVGTASDVASAMELGCDGVLLNTGIAGARDPLRMAHAMRLATEAGRLAAEPGRIPKKLYATASSPTEGMIAAAAPDRSDPIDPPPVDHPREGRRMSRFDPSPILGPDGAIARRLGDRFEARPEQMMMARAVARAIEDETHLMVEAGTGVGKSFAYLVPAILAAARRARRSSSRRTRSACRSSCSRRTSRSCRR